MKLIKNTFFYLFNENIYFSNDIKLNNLSVIQFHFLDYQKTNIYNEIEVKGARKLIVHNSINIIIDSIRIPNYEYYPISIKLIPNKNNNTAKILSFKFNLIHGLLNKINAFINVKYKNPYFYEYLYYSLNEIFFKTNKMIEICEANKTKDKKAKKIDKNKKGNDDIKVINIYDNFESSNRIRFNILNIPIQKEQISISNSIMVCEVFTEQKSTTVGIFDINEIENNFPQINSNDIFDNYYEDFGFIYNFLLNYNSTKDEEKTKKKEEFIKICKNNFIKNFESKNNSGNSIDFNRILYYENKITKSQMKTRIGFLVSYYLKIAKENEINDYFNDIVYIFSQIIEKKEHITDFQFLRLFKFLVKRKLLNIKTYKICIVSKLNKKSPYLKAYEFNNEEISKITEKSRLFMGYLQLDSYMLNNYLLKDHAISHSLSIEPLFFVKHHLKSANENFFLIESNSEDHYAQNIIDEKITIFNKEKIFENSILAISGENTDIIDNEAMLKSHAFAVSMELRHENNCHRKKNQKNSNIKSPIYYIDKTEIKSNCYLKDNKIQGEDGRLIESFISEDRSQIEDLQSNVIYGELLDINLFIQENFDELIKKKKIIDKSKDKFRFLKKGNQQNLNRDISEKKIENEDLDENYEKDYQILKRTGTLMISDEEYDIFLITQMIKTAKKNNSYNQLPKLLLHIAQRMEQEKKIE